MTRKMVGTGLLNHLLPEMASTTEAMDSGQAPRENKVLGVKHARKSDFTSSV